MAKKFFGVGLLVAAFALAVAGCGDPPPGGDPPLAVADFYGTWGPRYVYGKACVISPESITWIDGNKSYTVSTESATAIPNNNELNNAQFPRGFAFQGKIFSSDVVGKTNGAIEICMLYLSTGKTGFVIDPILQTGTDEYVKINLNTNPGDYNPAVDSPPPSGGDDGVNEVATATMPTDGRLIVTGLSAYNGRRIAVGFESAELWLEGRADAMSSLIPISDGQAEIRIYELAEGGQFNSYNGSHTVTFFAYIQPTAESAFFTFTAEVTFDTGTASFEFTAEGSD
jgi:hypothetical protein